MVTPLRSCVPAPFLRTEYNSDASCHYKVELSYENLVTSGPDPHPPPIADDESDDEDDDDVPRVSANVVAAILNSPFLQLPMSSQVRGGRGNPFDLL